MADDGAEKFLRLSKALKQAGKTDLRRELNKGLRDAARPLIAKTRAAARRDLPHSGGLAQLVAKTPQRIQVRTGATTAGVRIVAGRAGSGARGTNKGVIRHPVFGTDVFVDQKVPSGWFDDTIKASAADVRTELERAVERVAQQVVRQAK